MKYLQPSFSVPMGVNRKRWDDTFGKKCDRCKASVKGDTCEKCGASYCPTCGELAHEGDCR